MEKSALASFFGPMVLAHSSTSQTYRWSQWESIAGKKTGVSPSKRHASWQMSEASLAHKSRHCECRQLGMAMLVDPFSAAALIGVPVKPFPRWLRCVKCGLLSPYDAGLFKLRENRYRPELTRFVHEGCRGSNNDQRARDADAVPARFLMACRAGHLDDFAWDWFVHGGPSSCRATLRFFESGASLAD